MIRMSKLADYAFVILTRMASEKKELWPASSISEVTAIPLPTVAKLMKILARGGIVTASRGVSGGYRLVASPSAISVASVIESVDGPVALIDCVDNSDPDCVVSHACHMNGGWSKVNSAVLAALSSVSLADMSENRTNDCGSKKERCECLSVNL